MYKSDIAIEHIKNQCEHTSNYVIISGDAYIMKHINLYYCLCPLMESCHKGALSFKKYVLICMRDLQSAENEEILGKKTNSHKYV